MSGHGGTCAASTATCKEAICHSLQSNAVGTCFQKYSIYKCLLATLKMSEHYI